MALSFCIDMEPPEEAQLLAIARRAIEGGLSGGENLPLRLQDLPEALLPPRGVFVTLTRTSRLRGCIGSIEASTALAQAVADAAYGAAFRDPRFPALCAGEVDATQIEISILSPLASLAAGSRADLLDSLCPGSDGLLIEDGRHSSTFLPTVWEQLPSPEEFLAQLFAKAGLPADHWSETLRLYRYHTVCLSEPEVTCNPPGADP